MRFSDVPIFLVVLTFSGCSSSPLAPSPSATSAVTDGANASLALRTLSRGGADDAGVAGNSKFSAVKRATAAYHDVSKAVADGYAAPTAAACVESPAGAMGVHSVNEALASDTVVDPLRPEVLLYLPKKGGGFSLVGVEYFAPLLLRNTATNAVAPWFSLAPWPSSFVVVNPAPTLFGQRFNGFMSGHEPGMPWHYDLHVWAWASNPSGDFAEFNPQLSCSGKK